MELRTINSIRLELPRFTVVFLKVVDVDSEENSSTEMDAPFWVKLRIEPNITGYFECHEDELHEIVRFIIDEAEFFAPLSFFLEVSLEPVDAAEGAHCAVLDFIAQPGVEAVVVSGGKYVEYPLVGHPILQAILLFNPMYESRGKPNFSTPVIVV